MSLLDPWYYEPIEPIRGLMPVLVFALVRTVRLGCGLVWVACIPSILAKPLFTSSHLGASPSDGFVRRHLQSRRGIMGPNSGTPSRLHLVFGARSLNIRTRLPPLSPSPIPAHPALKIKTSSRGHCSSNHHRRTDIDQPGPLNPPRHPFRRP